MDRADELRRAADRLPLPIASCLARFNEDGDVRELFFTVEALLRYVCILVKSAYLSQPGAPLADVNDAMRRDLILPSMGSWQSFLKRTLPLVDDGALALRVPGLADLVRSLTSDGASEIVNLRNVVHGHAGRAPTPEMEREVLGRCLPALRSLIGASGPIQVHPLVVCSRGEWLTAMGSSTALQVAPQPPSIAGAAPAAIVSVPGGDLPLFPLVVGTFSGFEPDLLGAHADPGPVLMFDGVSSARERLVYMGQFGRGTAREWFPDYRRAVEAKRVSLLPGMLGDVPPEDLLRRLDRAMTDVIESAHREERFHGHDLELDPRVLGLLEEFMASDASVAFVTGEAGLGKSAHLLSLGARLTRSRRPVLWVDAGTELADAKHSFKVQLRAALEAHLELVGDPMDLLERLGRTNSEGGRIVLVLDGVDEIGSPARVRAFFAQVKDWIVKAQRVCPGLRTIFAIRTSCWLALQQARRGPLELLSSVTFRPTTRGPAGSDQVVDSIDVRPTTEEAAGKQYERLRLLPGHRSLTPFSHLAANARAACTNPRWMTRLLRVFDRQPIPPLGGPEDVWLESVDASIYRLVNDKQPVHPARVKIVDALLDLQIASGQLQTRESRLWADPRLGDIVASGAGREELREIESAGLLRVEGDPQDPFESAFVRVPDRGLGVVLHFRGPRIRKADPIELSKLLEEVGDHPVHALIADASALRLAQLLERESATWLEDFDVDLAARALLTATRRVPSERLVTHLRRVAHERGDLLLAALLELARAGGETSRLTSLARTLSADDAKPRAAIVRFVTRVLRHAEAIDELSSWLTGTGGGAALLCLGEVLRDKGQWRRAIDAYNRALDTQELSPSEICYVLAARGESYIWRQLAPEALADLDRALEMAADALPETRCNLHLKRAIAHRRMNKPIRALQELAISLDLARRHHFRTEETKVLLEVGLVGALLDEHAEALNWIQQALERHRAEAFVKGEKKALYCLGYLHEVADRPDEARAAYRESLKLNERHFDLLGLALNHEALARLSKGAELAYHSERHAQFRSRLDLEDGADGSLL